MKYFRISDSSRKRRVLVTGCCGFIGHHLVLELKRRKLYVIGVDNLRGGDPSFSYIPNLFYKGSFDDIPMKLLRSVNTVYHLAAQPKVPLSFEDPVGTHRNNALGVLKLLLDCARAKVDHFVFSSSSSVYGDTNIFPTYEGIPPHPLSPYAIQKTTAEMYVDLYRKHSNMETCSLRYFNVFGEEQDPHNAYTGVITRFLENRRRGEPLVIYGDGSQSRDFTYVKDVVEANIIAAEKGRGVYNVGTGVTTSIREIAQAIGGEIVYRPARQGDPKKSQADNSRMLATGWRPTKNVLDWIKEQK